MTRGRRWLMGMGLAMCLGCPAPEGPDPDEIDDVPRFDDDPGWLVTAHAHNDYYHERPLLDALAQRFYSVEADVFLSSDELSVAHYPWEYYGSLSALYLDPLQKLVDSRGSVYGDGVPFTLWIDIKESSQDIAPMMEQVLSRYDMLETFTDAGGRSGAVTVVLTGDAANKQSYVESTDERFAVRDSNDYDAGDPDADRQWTHYALNWGNYVDDSGQSPLTAAAETTLGDIVAGAHDKGRAVRFYDTPDTEDIWRVSAEARVDFVHTDDLEGLGDFLRGLDAPIP